MSGFNNDDWDKDLGLHQISQEEKDKEQEKKEVWDKLLNPEPEDSSAEASKQKTSGIAKTMAGIAAGAVVAGAVTMAVLATTKDDELNTHTISFDFNIDMEEVYTSEEIVVGTKIKDLVPRKVRGYKFIGWFKDDNFTIAYDDEDIVTANSTIYGKYLPVYKIEFPKETEGYSFIVEDKEIVSGDNYSFEIKLLDSHSKSQVKVYLARGEGEREELLVGENGKYIIENIESHCKVEVEGVVLNTYTVTFKNGVHVLKKETITHNEFAIGNDIEEPTKEYHKFIGWGLTTESNDVVDIAKYNIKEDLILYAKFEHIEYAVRFINGSDGELTNWTFTVKGGQFLTANIVLPSPDPDLESTIEYNWVFEGWAREENGEIITDFTQIQVTGDLNLYAVYRKEYFTFKINLDVSENIELVTINVLRGEESIVLTSNSKEEDLYLYYGDIISIIATPKTGHGAKSIKVSGGIDDLQNGTYKVNGYENSINIEVSEELLDCQVKFISMGKVVDTQTIKYFDYAVLPEDPEKEDDGSLDYTFSHWSLTENGEEVDVEEYPITGNVTFYAVFTSAYWNYSLNISYADHITTTILVTRGGETFEITNTSSADERTLRYGDKFKLVNSSQEGYEISSISVTGDVEENNGEYTIKDKNGQIGNEIINILIVDKIIKCNIEFVSEDEVVSSQVVDYFGFAQLPDNPSKESTVDKYYTFSHWALTEDGNAVDISTYEINGDKKFYAVFEENYKEFELDIAYLTNIDISVNVTRNDEILGTYTSEDNVKLRYGDIIEVLASAHEGFSVVSVLVDGATAIQDGKYIVNGIGKITISASDKVENCEVSFVSEGKIVSSQTIQYGQYVDVPANPEKSDTDAMNYTFSHWSLTENGEAVDLLTTPIKSTTVTFYAVFTSVEWDYVLNVDYSDNITTVINVLRGGESFQITKSSSQDDRKLRFGDVLEIVNTPNEGYELTNVIVTGEIVENNGKYVVTNKDGIVGDGTISVAITEKITKCNVQFVSNGSIYDEQEVNYFGNPTLPSAPTKEDTSELDYTFSHWSLSENGEAVDVANYEITGDKVFYAVFSREYWDYVIDITPASHITTKIVVTRDGNTFEINSSSTLSERSLRHGDSFIIVNEMSEGYELKGVEVSGNVNIEDETYYVADNDGVIGGDGAIKIVVTEEIITCNVQFISNGSIYNEQEVNYFGNPALPSTPTKEDTSELDYTFSHWSLSENGEAVDVANYEITGDKVFYAVFSSEHWDYVVDITPASHITTKLLVTRDGNTFEINSSSPLSERSLRHGDTFEVVNTLHEGYNLSNVVVTGEVNESNGKYTVTNKDGIIGDGTITIVISEEIIKCNVQFISEGNVYNEQEINYFEYATIPSNPTKDSTKEYSYIFSHWSTTEGGSSEDVATYQIKGNATFYAVFDEVLNNVTLNIDSVESGCCLQIGHNLSSQLTSNVPSVNDNTSIGWYLDSEFKNPVTEDMTVNDGITLYTRMATLDKIIIDENGAVRASDKASGDIVIPNSATSIADEAFLNRNAITGVLVSRNVVSIGNSCFRTLTSLSFAGTSKLESIGEYLCNYGNTTIIIPASVKKMGPQGSLGWGTSSVFKVVFEDPYGWYATETENADSGLDIDPDLLSSPTYTAELLFGGMSGSDYSYQYWYKRDPVMVSVGVNIDGVNSVASMPEERNLLSMLQKAYPDVSDNTSIGWYLDSEFKNPVTEDMTVTDGITLYTRMATLDKITITDGVVMAKDTSITGEVVIPKSATSIGEKAFSGRNITSIIISSNITRIEESALSNFNGKLTSVKFVGDSKLEYIGDGAFSCSKSSVLESIIIPASVKEIGETAFWNNHELHTVLFEENSQLEKIGARAFGCEDLNTTPTPGNLSSITIPASVKEIGWGVFNFQPLLTSVIFEDPNNWFVMEDEGAVSGVKLSATDVSNPTTAAKYFTDDYIWYIWTKLPESQGVCTSYVDGVATSYLVNSGDNILTTMATLNTDVTDYNSCGYFYDENLTQVVGDDDVFEDGKEITLYTKMATLDNITITDGVVMAKDTSITGEVVIPKSATSIGDYAFKYCYGLPSIIIPSSVTSIGESAFSGCSNLTSIEIPAGVTNIGDWAFANCPSLISIVVDENNSNYASLDGILYTKDMSTLIQCPLGKTGEVIIPSEVVEIGNDAFMGCSALTSVIFEENSQLEYIGKSAFENCSMLNENDSLDLPSNLKIIDEYAFSGCAFVYIAIPESVTTIGVGAFALCNKLEFVAFNSNSQLKCISASTFRSCSSLRRVVLLSQNLVSIGEDAFADCVALDMLNIPISVTEIGNGAFSRCHNLTSVVFAENSNLQTISGSAFRECSSLTDIIIPASVTFIGAYAFYDCYNLTSVVFEDSTYWYIAEDKGFAQQIMADDETVALVLAGRLEEEQFNIYDLTKKEEEPTELIKGSDLGPM